MTAATRADLEQLEGSGLDLQVVLCWLVRDEVAVPEAELNGARRRAIFTLAAGGDPHRDLEAGSVAAARLAEELATPERQAQLTAALTALPAEGLASVSEALAQLLADPELAWHSFALALLADEIAEG